MKGRWLGYVVMTALVAVLLAYLGLTTGVVAPYLGGYDPSTPDEYDHATVTVVDGETGEELGELEAAVADTFSKRYVGLSETDELPPNRGMLFVHDASGEHTYVMRNMSFGIDIVFISPNGTVTGIHHAPEPAPGEDGSQQRYSGDGKYVLEVNYGWTVDRDIEPGDRIQIGR